VGNNFAPFLPSCFCEWAWSLTTSGLGPGYDTAQKPLPDVGAIHLGIPVSRTMGQISIYHLYFTQSVVLLQKQRGTKMITNQYIFLQSLISVITITSFPKETKQKNTVCFYYHLIPLSKHYLSCHHS
jgi:hypothetical protein